MENKEYPLIIIGAGPAGLTASIYASRYGINHLIIGATSGGLMSEAHQICNFPTEKNISGAEIVNKMREHAESLGTQIIIDQVTKISPGQNFQLKTREDKDFSAETILLATGTQHRRLELPEEKKFLGQGLSYCATCDAQFYKNQIVAVIGSGDSATTASLYLAKIAKKVYQICRGPQLHGERIWINQVTHHPRIEVIYERQIAALEGEKDLEAVVLDKPYQKQKRIPLQGIFVEIGTIPQKLLTNQLALETNTQGYIKVRADQRTSNPHVWAAGDITDSSDNVRQIITAASEGTIAANSIFAFFQKKSLSRT
jgi:thioredoxin reductase (NADPH)